MFMYNDLSFTEAIREGTFQSMESDSSIVVLGLGVTYPNGADGTTKQLVDRFPNRVFDTPVSEGCVTGAGVGAAVAGMRPLIVHGRVEFALYGIDQIVTQAAKWNYMFGGGNPVPIVFRIAVGRQWGNGPQHTQALYCLFGSVPGLKVVIPSRPSAAKGLLTSALRDDNPVVFLEPRWLYGTRENVRSDVYYQDLDKAQVMREGADATLVTYGDGVIEAIRAASVLQSHGISLEVIDLVSLKPIDHHTIWNSVSKTGRLITFDTTHRAFCIGSEVVSKLCQRDISVLKHRPVGIACPDVPCPTSTSLTAQFYPTRVDIIHQVHLMLNIEPPHQDALSFEELHMAPKFDFAKCA
jgi:acetoin:2,6-dichlorophenolindophenol oxidoreductase subunit beta